MISTGFRVCFLVVKNVWLVMKLVQISPIMILVNSGAFLSISSWFCELTELIFVMIPYIYSNGYNPNNAKDYGYVQVANKGTRMVKDGED